MAAYQPSPVDRSAHRRVDGSWLADAWPRARVLLVHGGTTPSRDGASLEFVNPTDAPAGDRYFLGADAAGTAYFAVATTEPVTSFGRAADLRHLWTVLGERDARLLTHAVALERWHRAHPRCARCGAETAAALGGHVRRCSSCQAEHYPHTDPAVIMLVRDGADRCLLGHQPSWPDRRFSTLAGFVEPGESVEDAVAREVGEEVGVTVTAVEYVASQPWPFPSSLMLGFFADSDGADPVPDGAEITEARWFTREELARAVSGGAVLLPSRVSIARRLVERWYGGAFEEAG